MPQHVDIVKNEWLVGSQVVVARVALDDHGSVAVETADESWCEVVLRPVGGLDPEADPRGFLAGLADAIHGSYLFATHLHDAAECPFGDTMNAPIESAHERQPSKA
jgi:hypothetical protein